MNLHHTRRISTLYESSAKNPSSSQSPISVDLRRRNWNTIPLPHRTIPEPKGQDLDFVNVAHSHLIHSDWSKLDKLSQALTPFRVNCILLKVQKDYVLSLEFFKWIQLQNPNSITLETHSLILHILTKKSKFKSAESIFRKILESDSNSIHLPFKIFEAILYSYRLCDSSPRVFDSLFKTYAHMKKFRNATNTFRLMKDYGFLPNVESCNAYLSSLIDSNQADIALAFYREMHRSRISPNVYTLNMAMNAFCKLGKLEKAVELFEAIESKGFTPTVASYNTLISGYCNLGLLSSGMKLKNAMKSREIHPNHVTFNTLIHGFCREGKLLEANKLLNEMKGLNIAPNTVTYNALINGFSKVGNSEMGSRLFEEMSRSGVKADIFTYNALILGLCKLGKTKNAAYLVKELDRENLVPNSSTFSALISGQCARNNSERALQLYRSMINSSCYPNQETLNMLLSVFCKNEDYDGAVLVLNEMLERCLAPISGVLTEFFAGLSRCGKTELVFKIQEELEARNLLPDAFQKAENILST